MGVLNDVYGRPASQREPVMGREAEMVENAAGGYVFKVDDWVRLERFLILGTEGGSYYVGDRDLSIANARAVQRCIEDDGPRVVDTIQTISKAGRAARNDPALFALAMAISYGDVGTRQSAEAALPAVARTGTHILHFASFVDDMGGWRRHAKRAVADWYRDAWDVEHTAYQAIKYRQRDGWSHADLLRLSHPKLDRTKPDTAARRQLFDWIAHPETLDVDGYTRMATFRRVQDTTEVDEIVRLVHEHSSWLTHEMIPKALLAERRTWEALLPHLQPEALIRNLATLTRKDILRPMNERTASVAQRLMDRKALREARVHPMQILVAAKTYASGRSAQGKATWTPVPEIVDALGAAFDAAFDNVEPIDRRVYIAVDISGSMDHEIMGYPNLTARQAACAMAMVLARKCRQSVIRGFSVDDRDWRDWRNWRTNSIMTDLGVTPASSLADVLKASAGWPAGGTDCALPMRDALSSGIEADAIVILTDNDTWAGQEAKTTEVHRSFKRRPVSGAVDMPPHPFEALKAYRRYSDLQTKLVVMAVTATDYSIADPHDAGMLDLVGFDGAGPGLLQDFISR